MAREYNEEEIRAAYPQMAWLIHHPEIGPILREAYTQEWPADKFQARIMATTWWRSTQLSIREFDARQQADPATVESEIQTRIAQVSDLALAMGHDPTGNPLWTRDVAYKALRFGWNDQQINDYLLSEMKLAPGQRPPGPGTYANAMAAMEQLGAQYFVPVSNEQASNWAYRIVGGGQTVADMEAMFRDQAQKWFPHLADRLDAGQTMAEIWAPYQQMIAQILELNPSTIDPVKDKKWLEPLTFVDEKAGQRAMTMTEAQRWLRSMPEFRNTKGALDSVAGVGQQILEMWGKVS